MVRSILFPTGRTASPLEVSCEAGSFGYGRATVTSGGTVGAWDVWGGATISESAGYRDHSRSEDGRFMGNVGYQFNEHWANRLTLGYSNSDSELPGALTRAQMEDDPQQTNPGNIINDAQRNYPLFRVGDKIAWTTSTQHVELAAGYSHKELYHPLFFFFAGPNPVGPVIDQESNDGVLSLGYTGQFSNHRMTSLIVTSAGLTHAERYFNNKGDEGALLSEAYQRSTNATLDIADECEVVPGTFPSFGLQFARSTRELDDQFEINGVDYSDEFSFSQVNPRIGVRQHITKEAQIFGNVSRSCDPPSFGELVPIGTTPGLLDLEAQSAWTAEIGSRAGYEQASWDLSLYYAWITNELLSYQTAPNQNTTLNAEDTRHAGVELGSTVVPLQNLFMQDQVMVRMNYLFNWFRFEDDSVYGNNQIAGVPPQVITAEAMYEFLRGWYAGPTVEAASAGYVDLANTTQAPGWATFGVKAGYRAKNGFSGWVEARNLGNVTYASSYHVVTQANPNSAVYLPGDGRAYYAGAGWRW